MTDDELLEFPERTTADVVPFHVARYWDMVALGDGAYGKGKVWSPDRDKTYSSKLQLNGNSLSVQGCVFGICRDGGTWSRVN